jgi:hypothetical protein
MRIFELIRYSGGLLRGRRLSAALVCMLPFTAGLLLRSAEGCIYTMLVYFGGIKPLELFSGGNIAVPLIAAAFTAVRWTACAPLGYTAAYRLSAICGCVPERPLFDVLNEDNSIRRSIAAQFWTKLFSMLALAPAAFFGITAYSLFTSGNGSGIMALHASLLTVLSIGIWLSLKLSFAAVPFLLVRYPGSTALRTVMYSVRFMSGRRSVLLRLMLIFLPELFTIGAAPFAAARIKTAFALSIDIFTKEEEYLEGIENDRRHRRSDRPAKLPRRKKGCFKTAPH